MEIENIVWKEGEYFVSQCLDMDISSFGNTKEEALTNLNEAVELYLGED
jgi:predicted RNase H-like HicB family nuclease